MKFSGIGILADVFLYEIQNHTKNVELGEFVVMPNHVHLVLILNGENGDNFPGNIWETGGNGGFVETLHATSLQSSLQPPSQQSSQPPSQQSSQQSLHPKNETMSKISPKSDSVSTIIRSYKSSVSKHAHRLGFTFEWQERFHDHVIRNDNEYRRIVYYIRNNPQNWKSYKFNKLQD